MKKLFPDLPGWSFDIDEVSTGVYEVVASDKHGRRFSSKDTDPEVLLERCRKQAAELVQQTRSAT
jgi:hypothetical protein